MQFMACTWTKKRKHNWNWSNSFFLPPLLFISSLMPLLYRYYFQDLSLMFLQSNSFLKIRIRSNRILWIIKFQEVYLVLEIGIEGIQVHIQTGRWDHRQHLRRQTVRLDLLQAHFRTIWFWYAKNWARLDFYRAIMVSALSHSAK